MTISVSWSTLDRVSGAVETRVYRNLTQHQVNSMISNISALRGISDVVKIVVTEGVYDAVAQRVSKMTPERWEKINDAIFTVEIELDSAMSNDGGEDEETKKDAERLLDDCATLRKRLQRAFKPSLRQLANAALQTKKELDEV